MTIFNYAMLRGFRKPLVILFNVLLPLILIFIRPLWVGEGMVGVSLIAMMIMIGTFFMSETLLIDKASGAVIRIMAAPITTFRYLVENLLAALVPWIVQLIIVVLIGLGLYGWTLTFSLALLLCYTIFTVTSIAFAFAWHCLFKNRATNSGIFSAVLTLMAFLSGLIIPVHLFPSILEYIGAIFPAYWVSRGFTDLISYGHTTGSFWLSMGILVLFTMAYLLYGGKRRIV